MPPKKLKGPSLFGEWVVGTTIASALGPLPAPREKPRKRNVVCVRVTTDDEACEDTLRITYPRSERWKKGAITTAAAAAETKTETAAERKDEVKEDSTAKAEEAKPEAKPTATAEDPPKEDEKTDEAAKKVRFEQAPKKSALKKTSESETEATSASETDTEAQSCSENEAPEKPTKSKKAANGKSKKVESSASATESESEEVPHPTCSCVDCVRARERLGKKASEDEASEVSKKSKKKRKAEKKTEESDAESQTDTAPEDSGKEEEKTNKKGKKHDKNAEESESEMREKENPKGETTAKKKKVKSQDKSGAETSDKETEKPGKTSKKAGGLKGNYPEAFPLPHPRRPNLIVPIRAEVVQTERVVETPEDPPPNAYYDQLHNIVRVYHGPVYGGHGHALYPRRNPNSRPLPIGVPHPTQNPYYHGFNNLPRPSVYDTVPMSAWNAAIPPPGFPPVPPAPWADQYHNKGAFNMSGAMPAPPSIAKNKTADNNVAPDLKPNPYYKGRKQSAFSNFGGSRTTSDTSPQHVNSGPSHKPRNNGRGTARRNAVSWGDNNVDNGGQNNNDTRGTGTGDNNFQQASGWDNSNDQSNWNGDGNNYNGGGGGGDTTWGASNANQGDSWGSNENTSGDATWGSTNNNQNWGDQTNYNTWDNANAPVSTWDIGNNATGTTWGETQGNNNTWGDMNAQQTGMNGEDPGGEPAVDSNVGPASGTEKMPGSWHSEGDAQIPAWGDQTIAASTGGRIDQW